ncbi:MAG: cation-translocating P-type ATPase [Bacteroidia bacterium]
MYNQSISHILQQQNTSAQGLSLAEAKKRLAEVGLNELQEKKKLPVWRLFLNQFKDFMIIVLLAAAILSGIMGDITDTIIILIIVVLNAIIGFTQEYKAEKAMEALKKMTITQTQVLRDNQPIIISATELVPGDMVIIEAGNVVPADMRMIETHSLRIDESSLTGESIPVDKNSNELNEQNIPLGDQFNIAFKGTLVTNGRAKGVVVATGMKTELGKIANLLQEREAMTPLQARMVQFGKKLSYIVLAICLVLFVTGLLRGDDPFKMLLLSISLAVAAIPEALPAMITIVLAGGASRLAKKQALVRKLPSVETLGSATYICSDKTGTLTQNKMKVVEKHEVSPLLSLCMALNHDVKFNDKKEPFGESTELALVQNIIKSLNYEGFANLIQHHNRLAELPFDSDRKCMTTLHHYHNGQYLIVTKGASEAITAALLKEEDKNILKQYSDNWANEGQRVLAYAYKIVTALPEPFTYEIVEKDLLLAGVVGLIDPPREEVKVAIAECKTAGIKPVMITGDHPATAKAIAREIGILGERDLVMTGTELQQMSEEAFNEQVENVAVYARVSPDQKLRIVRTLQSKGHFVSMTGDGVNDAPSLKAANIGVAMGINGTDVSKEAADLVLLDDNFATIVKAVKEGRRIYDNIRKFIKYTMTSNAGEIWTIFLAPLVGLPIPLLPIHILWINLVTDGLPGLALAIEPAEENVMKLPPRKPDESIFANGLGWHILWVGLLMGAVCLGLQAWAMHNNDPKWQTYVFTVLCFSQMGHVFSIRSQHFYLFQQGIFSNLALVGAVFLTFILQLALLYIPFLQDIFHTQALTLKELGMCVGVSLIVFHGVELEKWVRGKWGNSL